MHNILVACLAFILLTMVNTNATPANADGHKHPDLKNMHYSIKGDNVVLHSLIGDIQIPMTEKAKEELKEMRAEENKEKKRVVRQVGSFWRGTGGIYNYDQTAFPDFFECNEQAQIALSPYSENHRYWEAFFKRNSVNDTISVRYCCNLLEYVDNAEMSLSPYCRDQIRLQDHVMIKPEIRYTCRQYEFYNVQCFMIRWMYWWIPLILLILIGLGIFYGCASIRGRRNKSQLHDDVRSLKEARLYDENSNKLPYRPHPYTTSPLKSPATNKAYAHH